MSQHEIYMVLKEAVEPLNTKDIALKLNMNPNKVSLALKRMIKYFPVKYEIRPTNFSKGVHELKYYFLEA